MARTTPQVLTMDQLASYQEQGFVRVEGAFRADVALRLVDEIWSELNELYAIDRNDPSTWLQPARAPRRAKTSQLNEHVASARVRGVISDLRDSAEWAEPRDWGGFLVTFPQAKSVRWDVPTDTWHWDGAPNMAGPFIFSFYSEVRPQGGGTLLLSGSHRLLARFYESLSPQERQATHKQHRRLFSAWDPWLVALTGQGGQSMTDRAAAFMKQPTEVQGVPVQVVELCGDPGDAIFCSPLILHAIAPNCSDRPRFMRSKFFFDQDRGRGARDQIGVS